MSPIGVSQMPTTRSPRTPRIASVTMPAGFVKLMTQASGATRRIVSASETMSGIVRSAYANPPGPTVSWPSTPRPRAMRSSATLPAVPPTRTALNTKSVPRRASSRSVVTVTRGAKRFSLAMRSTMTRMIASRSGDTS